MRGSIARQAPEKEDPEEEAAPGEAPEEEAAPGASSTPSARPLVTCFLLERVRCGMQTSYAE